MQHKAKTAKKHFLGFQVNEALMQRILAYKAKKEAEMGVTLRMAQVLRAILEKEV